MASQCKRLTSERLQGARREELRWGKVLPALGGFFFSPLNEPLAEVTKKIQFLPESTRVVTEESARQDMTLKIHSLECPLAPGL